MVFLKLHQMTAALQCKAYDLRVQIEYIGIEHTL